MADVYAEIESLTQQANQFLNSGNENKYKVLMERVNQLKYSNMTDVQLMQLGYEELQEAKRAFENTEEFDINKYNIVVNALAEKAPEEAAVQETVTASFVQEIGFDFDANAGTGMLNQIAALMFKKVSTGYELQIRQKDDTIKGLEETVTNLTFQNKSLQETNASLGQYKLENEDYKLRFDAAAAQLAEYEQEIARLKRRESELQQQLANAPAPTARQIVDISDDEALKQLMDQAKEMKAQKAAAEEAAKQAAKPKITNVRWEKEVGIGAKSTHLAELVGNYPGLGNDGETIKIGHFDLPQYNVLDQEEASRFRSESLATSQAPIVESVPLVEEAPNIVTVEQFRPDEDPVRHNEGLDTPAVGEVAPKSLEEAFRRIEALEMAVYQRPVINGVA